MFKVGDLVRLKEGSDLKFGLIIKTNVYGSSNLYEIYWADEKGTSVNHLSFDNVKLHEEFGFKVFRGQKTND